MLLLHNARVRGSSLDLDECMKFILVLFQGFKSMYETICLCMKNVTRFVHVEPVYTL